MEASDPKAKPLPDILVTGFIIVDSKNRIKGDPRCGQDGVAFFVKIPSPQNNGHVPEVFGSHTNAVPRGIVLGSKQTIGVL